MARDRFSPGRSRRAGGNRLGSRLAVRGFADILLFVIFEFGFVGAAMIFAESILHAIAWLSVLVGNLLAAAAMAAYFWRHHGDLQVSP